jgi:hypothetical protein
VSDETFNPTLGSALQLSVCRSIITAPGQANLKRWRKNPVKGSLAAMVKSEQGYLSVF